MSAPPVEITVIIPTMDRPRVLERNLTALATSEGVDLACVEVIVIDDGSGDGETQRVLEAFAGQAPFPFHSLHQPNAGQAAARNRAMQQARGRIWLFINDDTIPTPSLLASHLAAHTRHGEAHEGILGRVTLAPEIPRTTPRDLHLDHMWATLEGREALEWHHFWTTNVSVKSSFMKSNEIAFDPAFRYVHDDTEIGRRLDDHGFRLFYAPDALGFHDHPIDQAGFLRMAEREAASLHRWATKDPARADELARFGYTPAKAVWERAIKYPLLTMIFNRVTVPIWAMISRTTEHLAPPVSRFLLSQCYAACKRRSIARLGGGSRSESALPNDRR